uniref:Filamentous growth regulator 23-like n=1 Tax=Saccoglossus kowalevskii TaxID=10224 RepID=A0ABM0MM09_SACKO|nr:PREDICTED: filamentous growth regulator 23-like [Saccoglossus kowalevskii]
MEHPVCSNFTTEHPVCSNFTNEHPVCSNFTTEHPVCSNFTTEHPVCSNFTTEHPVCSNFTTEHPVCSNFTMEHPVCSNFTTVVEHLVCSNFTTEHPVCSNFTNEHPVCSNFTTVVEHPVCSNFTTEHPVCSNFTTEHPVCSNFTTEHLVCSNFTAEHPVCSNFTTEHPVCSNFTAEHPVCSNFTTEHPVCSNFTTEHPVCNNFTNEHPVCSNFTTKHPVCSNFTTEHPVCSNFTTEHPVCSNFTTEHPVCSNFTNEHPVCREDCETITLTEPTGTLSSPNYPNNYPPKVDCTVNIVLPNPNAIILVEFEDFYLEKPDDGICFDKLEITDNMFSENNTVPYCGVLDDFIYTSQSNNISLTLHTDSHVEQKGYSATYRSEAPPVFENCPEDITLNGTSFNTTVLWIPPTAIAYISGDDVNVTSSHTPGDSFPLGNTTVVYSATVADGSTAKCTFVVSVQAYLMFVNCPDDITLNSSSSGTIVSWTPPTAYASIEGGVTSSHNPGDTFPVGNTTVIYEATDVDGNTARCTFVVSIEGNEVEVTSTPKISDTGQSRSGQGGLPWYYVFYAVVGMVLLISAAALAIFFSCGRKEKQSEKIKLVKKYKSRDIDEDIGKSEIPNPP